MKRSFYAALFLFQLGMWSCTTSTEKTQHTSPPPPVEETKVTSAEKPKLPNFQVLDLEGKPFTTAQLPKNKPTVVVIFHPDCEHCQAEATEFQKHLTELGNVNFMMITWDPIPKIAAFMQKYQLKEPITAWQIDNNTLFQTYGVLTLPAVFIYNSNQELVQQFNGEAKAEAILTYLK